MHNTKGESGEREYFSPSYIIYSCLLVLLLNYRLLITIVDGRTHCKCITFAAVRIYSNNLISTLNPESDSS